MRLTADGAACPLEPKSFRLLQFLIENRQRVVPKEELLTAVWEGVAVSDNALTRAIAQVRKALADDPKDPTYVETIPTVGYRFMAAIEPTVPVPTVPEPPVTVSSPPLASLPAPPPRSRGRIWVAVALAIALLSAFVAASLLTIRTPDRTPLSLAPFTSYPGHEFHPTFSPDANQVAFAWNGDHENNYDIYVKSIGSETPLRLTTAPEPDLRPQWSPDGQYIAFERQLTGGKTALMLIPPLGGAARKLAEFRYIVAQTIGVVSDRATAPSGLSWSRDGKWIAVCGDFVGDGTDRINLVSAETGEFRPLTQPPAKGLNDSEPSFSPYTNDLVFERGRVFSPETLYRLSLDANFTAKESPTFVYASPSRLFAPAWVDGGKELVIVSGPFGASSGGAVYSLPASGSPTLTPLASLGAGVTSLAISRDGRRAIYSVGTRNSNIWRSQLSGAPDAPLYPPQPEKWIASTKREVHPQYSPDGRRIVFYSSRSGSIQVWVCEADGSKPVRITNFPRGIAGSPRWSPDGRTVVFDSSVSGQYQVYSVSPEGGRVRQLTNGPSPAYSPSYSRDGKWIYFVLTGDKAVANVWKMPSAGGAPIRVTRNGGTAPQESPDGTTIYYVKPAATGSLWKMPVAGGDERQVADSIFRSNYAVTKQGIYLMSGPSIDWLNPDTGDRKSLFQTRNPDFGLAVSPDGRHVLWSQVDAIGSDLMLAENFR